MKENCVIKLIPKSPPIKPLVSFACDNFRSLKFCQSWGDPTNDLKTTL